MKTQSLRCHLCAQRGVLTRFDYSTPREPFQGMRVVIRDADTAASFGISAGSAINLCPVHTGRYEQARAEEPPGRRTPTSASDALRAAREVDI